MNEPKKHSSPISILGTLLFFAGLSTFSFNQSLTLNGNAIDSWAIISLITSLVLYSVSIVFTILSWVNEKMKKGDEFTTRIVYKSAYISFVFVMCLIALAFITFRVYLNKTGNSIDDLSVRIILSVFAGIHIVATAFFTLILFVLSKRGITDELP